MLCKIQCKNFFYKKFLFKGLRMEDIIEHSAYVEEVGDKKLRVRVIVDNAACKTCKVKKTCAVAKMNNKLVEVPKDENISVAQGEKIKIYFDESMGLKAVFLGYILPFIVLVAALAIFLQFIDNEGLAGLLALGAMILYYLILGLFNKKLQKTFSFKVKTENP